MAKGGTTKLFVTVLFSLTAVPALSLPVLAIEEVPPDTATTMTADDGTTIYCVSIVTTLESGDVVGQAFVDCPPDYAWPTADTESGEGAAQDLNNLVVGDSFVNHQPYSDAFTTATLVRAESGIKTSKYYKPDKGMTTLALFFTFSASDEGGRASSVDVFGPGGTSYDRVYALEGKYDQDWGYGDIRPGKTAKGWVVFEVPKNGTVEVVMKGYDADDEEVFATWIVES